MPDKAVFHYYLARLLEDDGEKKKAVEHYRRYLDLGGEDDDGAVKQRIKQLEG